MKGSYTVLDDGKLHNYTEFDHIPDTFGNLIHFNPDIIPAPHTHQEHLIMESFNSKLKELLQRETK